MIQGLTNSGAIPTLELMMQFTAQRQQLLAHNIANLSTPGFRALDVSVSEFQSQLGQAIDRRREAGSLHAFANESPNQLKARPVIELAPAGDNLLFHDENDRNVESVMQKMVENFLTFRAASQLYKSQMDQLSAAIRERI